jgi:O-antigen ligase
MKLLNTLLDRGYFGDRLKRNGPGTITRRLFHIIWGTDKRRALFISIVILALAWLAIVKIGYTLDNLIYIIVFAIGIILLFLYPFLGILFIMFTDLIVPFYVLRLPFINTIIPLSKFLGIFTLLAFLVNYTVNKKRVLIGERRQVFFLYLFTIIGVLSSFNAFRLKSAQMEVTRLLLLAIFYIIAFNLLDTPRKVSYFNAFIVLGAFITCFRSIYEAFILHLGRPDGGTGNPGGLTIAANLGFALLLVGFVESKGGIKRFAFLAGLFVTAAGVFISNARAGFVALFFTLFIQFIRKRKVYLNYIVVILVLVILLSTIPKVYTYRPEEFVKRVYERGLAGLEHEPRYALYKASIDMFFENPLLGVGPWNFRHIYYEEYAEKHGGLKRRLVPHSGILGLLAEFGFFAFVFFAGYVIVTAYIFRKAAGLAMSLNKPKEYIAVLTAEAGFWAFFIIGVFQDIAGYRPTYVFPAIGAAMYFRLLAAAKEEDEVAGNSTAVTDY